MSWMIKWALKRSFGTKRINGKYVWSRGTYLGDHRGDLETSGGLGLKV